MRWQDATETNMATFTEKTWSRAAAQAMLDAGRSILLESGVYDLGDGPVGLEFSQLDTHLKCFGKVRLNYRGTGKGLWLKPGSSGNVSGFELDGINLGHGIEMYGSAIRVRDYKIREFQTGLYWENAEVAEFHNGFILACEYGIDSNIANAQNHVLVRGLKFRNNSTHWRLRKIKCLQAENIDFENAYGYAIDAGSSGGGTFQGAEFNHCWFERNNTDYSAADDRAEILVNSGPNGLTVRNLVFNNCFWGNLSGDGSGTQNPSKHRIKAELNDVPGIIVRGGNANGSDVSVLAR